MSTENSGFAWGCVFAVLVLAYGVIQTYAGFLGIRFHVGTGWAIAAIAVMFLFRLSLPITIGSFFCAKDIWEWHWSLGLLFAAPGIAFMALMIPGALASVTKKFRS
jgi:hypothetical protein